MLTQIEFPSILLPPGISSGSIVDIRVSRNSDAESVAQAQFQKLQTEIHQLYGVRAPTKPVLKVRNATQTSIVLEWDPIDLATSTLRSLTLFRNNAKAGTIPNPTTFTSTKISGLAVDTEYTFHLVLRTSAGTLSSEKVSVRTHKMTDLTGITVCPGQMNSETRQAVESTLQRIGAKPLQDAVRIDTTHFVCTEGRGTGWERAQEMNIPVVGPDWLLECEKQGRIVGVRAFYLDASKPASNITHHHQPSASISSAPAPQPSGYQPPAAQPESPSNDHDESEKDEEDAASEHVIGKNESENGGVEVTEAEAGVESNTEAAGDNTEEKFESVQL